VLSPREREVAIRIVAGERSKAIALALHLSVATVRKHRENLMRKLHVTHLGELIAKARREP